MMAKTMDAATPGQTSEASIVTVADWHGYRCWSMEKGMQGDVNVFPRSGAVVMAVVSPNAERSFDAFESGASRGSQ